MAGLPSVSYSSQPPYVCLTSLVWVRRRKLSDETGTADRSADLQVDRKAFATWWLSNQLETKDANIEKQRLQARVQVLGTRLKSMAASLATFEEFANKATY